MYDFLRAPGRLLCVQDAGLHGPWVLSSTTAFSGKTRCSGIGLSTPSQLPTLNALNCNFVSVLLWKHAGLPLDMPRIFQMSIMVLL